MTKIDQSETKDEAEPKAGKYQTVYSSFAVYSVIGPETLQI